MAIAVQELDRLSADPIAQRRAQDREDSLRMYRHELTVSRLEGKAEGKAEVVLKLLTLRFGAPSEAVAARVLAASPADLDSFTQRLLTAVTPEEVVG